MYSFAEASRILRVRRSRLHYWDRTGLLCPSRQNAAGRRGYDFGDLVKLRALLRLLDAGASLQQIRRGLAQSAVAPNANANANANAEANANADADADADAEANAEAGEGALRSLSPVPAWPLTPLTPGQAAGGRTCVLLVQGGVSQELSGQLLFDFAVQPATETEGTIEPLPLSLPAPGHEQTPEPETPCTAFGWFERGFALADAPDGDVQGALDAYRCALTLDPDFVDAHLQRGMLLHAAAGELPAAEAAYRRVLALEPQHAEANYHLANLLEETGRGREARRCFETALRGDPDFADAWLGLALVCEAQRQSAGARRAWQGYLRCTGSGHWAAVARSRLR